MIKFTYPNHEAGKAFPQYPCFRYPAFLVLYPAFLVCFLLRVPPPLSLSWVLLRWLRAQPLLRVAVIPRPVVGSHLARFWLFIILAVG